MTRRAARITHDEVCRIVKALQTCGLPIGRVTFDGDKVDVIIGDSGEKAAPKVDGDKKDDGLIREPQP